MLSLPSCTKIPYGRRARWMWPSGRGNRLGLGTSLSPNFSISNLNPGDREDGSRILTRRTFVRSTHPHPILLHSHTPYLNPMPPPIFSRCCSRDPLPLHPHDSSVRCLVKNSPTAAQTTARPPSRQLMSISMSNVGPLSLKSTMLPSGTRSHTSLSFFSLTSLSLSHSYRWFHVRVCLVAGVGFFTDAYVIVNRLPRPNSSPRISSQLRYFRHQHRLHHVGLCLRQRCAPTIFSPFYLLRSSSAQVVSFLPIKILASKSPPPSAPWLANSCSVG